MCGIAGVISDRAGPIAPGLLEAMIRMERHRGPDGCSVYTSDGVGLAHARLSILDLAGGAQPMANEDDSIWITFNGEIFNYVELRQELFQRGHRFATQSDTEVLLHLYEDEGEDCVQRLNGQWAFAIWDARRRKLFLSRDRMGVRPLFYASVGDDFVFASEIKSLFAHPGVERRIDTVALHQIFTFWVTLPPRTAFRGVSELPPGHSLVVQKGATRLLRHWTPNYAPEPPGSQTDQDYAAQLHDLLRDATRLRLRSDVPVGAYLSGGLDSTVTAAFVNSFSDVRLRTFSVSFDDPEFDERRYQNEAVRHLDTDHQDVRCSAEDIAGVFPDVIWHAEKPILRTAPAPLFLLSRLVRDSGYKVVLTGEGSDEVLGGYDIFKEAKIRRFWAAHPDSRLRPLLLKRLYPYLPDLQSQPAAYRQAFFRVRPEDLDDPFFSHLPRWELTSRAKLFFSEELRRDTPCDQTYDELRGLLPPDYCRWDPLCQAQYLESAFLLPGYILSSQGDRVAMAHSVESRFPFLDHRVVEFAATLPPRLKMKALNEKYILKHCINGMIPASIKKRPKQPYRAPEGKSFFIGPGQDYVAELLSPDRLSQEGLFQPGAVGKLVAKFRAGRASSLKDNMALVGIVSTQLLVDHFIRNFSKKATAWRP